MENHGTIWVCQCCMLSHANGECCPDDTHGGDSIEPLSAVESGFHVAMGMVRDEHADECAVKCTCTHDDECAEHPAIDQVTGDPRDSQHHDPSDHAHPIDYECDCETDTFSTSQCDGCGSYLHGERHAMTLFKG